MNFLVVTNLYPPQELGGYGRSMADFVWGLRERGHSIQVLSSDAPHLGASSGIGPSGEAVDRRLQLKGCYENGGRALRACSVALGNGVVPLLLLRSLFACKLAPSER